MSDFLLETYKNSEVISVSQDMLGKQGERIQGGALLAGTNSTNIWARQLAHGAVAAVFLNNAETDVPITCDIACFSSMGFTTGQVLGVRDLWSHTDLPQIKLGPSTVFTPDPSGTAQGGSSMLRFTPK